MELSSRKRDILRRVVEEYVQSGLPVGSKTLVGRGTIEVSSSTVRGELAELESLGLLTHPHTSAGRVPTEQGYRAYAAELVDQLESRPGPFPIDLSVMRNELEEALQQVTEALSEATHLLALVSAPSIASAAIRHVEVVRLQPRVVIVVVITASGGVSKRMLQLQDPVDVGLVEWARAYLNETVTGSRIGSRSLRRHLEEPTLTGSERRFLAALRPALDEVFDQEARLFVGGAAGLLGDVHGDELEACQRLLGLLERRATMLAFVTDAFEPNRTVVKVGASLEGEDLPVAYVGSPYGLPNRSLGAVALLGPLRMDYEKAIRSVRAAAFELSRLVEEVYEGS